MDIIKTQLLYFVMGLVLVIPGHAQTTQDFFKQQDTLIKQERYALALIKIDSIISMNKIQKDTLTELNLRKSNLFTLLKLHDSAIYYLDKSMKEMRLSKDSSGLAKANTSMGILLNQVNRPDEALTKFRAHYDYVKRQDKSAAKSRRLMIANYNLGLTHFKLSQMDSALVYLTKADEIAQQTHNLFALSKIQGLLSQVNFKLGKNWKINLGKARDAALKNNDSIGLLKAYLTEAEFNLINNDVAACSSLLNRARSYLKTTTNLNLLINYYNLRYQENKINKNIDKSLEALERYNCYMKQLDSINNENKITVFNEQLKIYGEKLKTTKTLLKREGQIKRLTFVISVLLILLICLIAYLLLRRKKLKYIWKIFKLNRRNEDYQNKAHLNPERHELFKRIKHEIIENQLYLSHQLSLSYIAEIVNSNSTYVSEAVNTFTNSSFRTYINSLRINHAMQLIDDRVKDKDYANFDEIADATGFNSKTSFYRVFKQITELTPKEYLNLCKIETS